jgi:integrase
MLDLAKARSKRDYLLLSLMRWGCRVGEIVGWRGLPGIHPEDLREKSIWIKGKGYARGIVFDTEYPVPVDIMDLLRQYVVDCKTKPQAKIFPISEPWAEVLTKNYARAAGVEDWPHAGPHRLRAFFNSDMKRKKVDLGDRKDMMRHKSLSSTMKYEEELHYEEKQEVMSKLTEGTK